MEVNNFVCEKNNFQLNNPKSDPKLILCFMLYGIICCDDGRRRETENKNGATALRLKIQFNNKGILSILRCNRMINGCN